MTEKPELYTTRLRTFGRRQGYKLKPRQQRLVDNLLPELQIEPSQDGSYLDPSKMFKVPVKQVWFEVGFGGGEHAAAQVENNPDIGLIGCEPFLNGVGSLLTHVDDRNLQDRIRIYGDDARSMLDVMPDDSVERLFLLFPDPWRKRRHAKRRFVGEENLKLVSRVLKSGGEFRVGSDHMPYIDWTLEHLTRHADFEWICEGPKDWRERPADWPPTRYEQKAIRQGKACVYLRFKRK
ncbi:tRNA (guanine-N(7)-)-methyltransferase [Candidatus Terasakiella magnetica]|uniref:tRNA (guanine-N(7)-)-methyltransferase n=1 Tax=Candidatus Terasakiella magnetica TaxID=1867952 RepID=A0A1C3REF0_9PROT|nr:tRNA (guanine(46)-N(7))-methyltransferase TrmB [Candidatus Terasakiella magnetica]SCA55604.1 tRNA (guanine-N(7)-)-methyltransferase [Candidatus Terasakiella magnetica]